VVKILDYWVLILYDLVMTKTSEFRTKASEPSISAAVKAVFLPASQTEVPLNRGGFPVTAALELDLKPAWDASCLWCARTFTPRTTGGSTQKFLLHGTQATVLDRSASLDNEGDRSGPALGGLLEGTSRERARCKRGHSDSREHPACWSPWTRV
jgi:hypothetical protein